MAAANRWERLAAGIDRAILGLTRALAALGAGCIAAMAALTVAAVVMRYGVGAPFRFTEELAGLMLVSCVFLGLPYALARHAHIRVNLVADRLGGIWKRLLWVAGQAIFVAFAIVFFRDALADARFTQMLDLKSEVARLRLAPYTWIVVIGIGLAGAVAAWQALRPIPAASEDGAHP